MVGRQEQKKQLGKERIILRRLKFHNFHTQQSDTSILMYNGNASDQGGSVLLIKPRHQTLTQTVSLPWLPCQCFH